MSKIFMADEEATATVISSVASYIEGSADHSLAAAPVERKHKRIPAVGHEQCAKAAGEAPAHGGQYHED